MRNGLQGDLLVRQLPDVTERELEREDTDDRVHEAARHEARTCQDLERRGLDEAAAGRAGRMERCCGPGVAHQRCGLSTRTPGQTSTASFTGRCSERRR